jgi:diguanylate cyclase (GGDEF)-like protein/PAS domain S-box-containing protein
MSDDQVTPSRKLASYVNEHLRTGSSDACFDDFVDLTAQLHNAPIALIAFADDAGWWFKAQRGLPGQAIDRIGHLLARTIASGAPLTVLDAVEGAESDPELLAPTGARFYAGVPLLAVDEQPIGVLAAMDCTARTSASDPQCGGLVTLARRLVGEIERRQHSVDQQLQHEARFRFIADNVQDLISVMDTTGKRLYNNPAYRDLLGDPERLRGTFPFEDIHPEDRAQVREIFDRTVRTGKGASAEFRLVLRDRSIRYMESQGIPVLDDNAKVKEVLVVSHDVTKHRLRVEDHERYNRQLQARTDQMAELNKMANYLHRCDTPEEVKKIILQLEESRLFGPCEGAIYRFDSNLAQFEVFQQWPKAAPVAPYFSMDACWAVKNGFGVHVMEETDPEKGLCCEHVAGLRSPYLCVSMTGKGNSQIVLHLQLSGPGEPRNREELRVWLNAKRDLATAFAQHVAVALANLGRRKELEAAALTDALTGLYTRRFVQEELWKKVALANRNKSTLGLIAVDIDHFKEINDTYEHEGGDYALRKVATFLQGQLRDSDHACRIGGEEFMLILTNPVDEDSVLRVAEKVREGAKALGLFFEGRPIKVTLSLGVTFIAGKALPSSGPVSGLAREQAAQLTRVADAALYQAKKEGRDKVVFRHGEP